MGGEGARATLREAASTTRAGGVFCPHPRSLNEESMPVVKVLSIVVPATFLSVSVARAQDPAATPATPVARVVLARPQLSLAVGDSVRLEASALDASRPPIPDAKIVLQPLG